jgi:hypothetical protein
VSLQLSREFGNDHILRYLPTYRHTDTGAEFLITSLGTVHYKFGSLLNDIIAGFMQ